MNASATPATSPLQTPSRSWRASSLGLIALVWAVLQIGGLFTPGLLDDVDSVYIQIAREMLQRHNFVTPTIDGIRFFDKPPLMYWMAAGSMRLFGIHDWAARLPLAIGMLLLLLAVYALGIRLFRDISPPDRPDRAGLYAALATATCIGPYLYTRFYIPDMLVALWMTLAVHLFLIALDRARAFNRTSIPGDPSSRPVSSSSVGRSALLPSLSFGAVVALSVLTKGLIGLVFPLAFALLYLLCTGELRLLARLCIPAGTLSFLVIAAPWHILAALQNPPVAMPPDVGLPARAGWAWFYLYNEHIARFLGRRIPHDYGQVPIPLFWALLVLWLVPWAAFLWPALRNAIATLRPPRLSNIRLDSDSSAGAPHLDPMTWASTVPLPRSREPALALLLWAGVILGFFTLSSRQEYYHLPALPALALLVAGLLAAADRRPSHIHPASSPDPRRQALRWSFFFLAPLGALLFLVCGYFVLVAPHPHAGATLSDALSSNPALYDLSLGHVFDLTASAMGFFRGPLLTVALCMLALGPGSHLLRRRSFTFAANLAVTAAMTGVLLAAHVGLVRFYPILGSKGLALAVDYQLQPGDIIAIDGELTSGSTLLFYTGQPVLLVNGRINGPWFGSFWPDAPHIFLNDNSLDRLWAGSHRIFLLTHQPEARSADLRRFGPVLDFAHGGGKTILTNRP